MNNETVVMQPVNQLSVLVYEGPMWAYTQGRNGHIPNMVLGLVAQEVRFAMMRLKSGAEWSEYKQIGALAGA